jgi:dTDP-glucose 4,6-dehydratase
VDDNCHAILTVLEKGTPGSVYNIGTEQARTNLEVVNSICDGFAEMARLDSAKLKENIQFVADRPGHDRRYAINAAKVRKELGWAPTVPFAAGIKETVRWYSQNQDWITQVTSGEYREYYSSVYERAWDAKHQ